MALIANLKVETDSPKFKTAGEIQKIMATFEFFVKEASRSLVSFESR